MMLINKFSFSLHFSTWTKICLCFKHTIGRFPYAVSFGFLENDSYIHFCGGTIIASNLSISVSWAVSAAHCFIT